MQNETVWLNQLQMAELFQTTVPNVSMNIRNVCEEGELQKDSVVKEFLTTADRHESQLSEAEKQFEAMVKGLTLIREKP